MSNKIIENGRPVTTEAVCKLVKPPAIVIETDIAPINMPQIILCLILGLAIPPVAIPATICVVESALVMINIKISAIANALVMSAIGNLDNNSKEQQYNPCRQY